MASVRGHDRALGSITNGCRWFIMNQERRNGLRVCLVGGCLAALVVALVVPLGCTAASKPATRKLLGLFSENVVTNLKGKVPASKRGQVRNVKVFAQWRALEAKHKGAYTWHALDSEVNAALSIGVNSILITLLGPVPIWATNRANPKPAYSGPPKNMQDWQDFCHAVAARYRGYVDYYQIWQEAGWDSNSGSVQSGTVYYAGDSNFTYLGMLRAGYNGIKSADPNAQVITASLLSKLDHTYSDFSHYETLLAGSNQDVSMKITSNQNIVAERPMYFNYRGTINDGTDELGVPEPRTTWYLAEGSTQPGFQEYLTIQNPGNTDSNIGITYMFPGGTTQNQGLTVAAHSRATINVNDVVGPDKNVSVRVGSTKPVVIDRPMYFLYHGKWDGGSIGAGVPALSSDWYLAEGTTHTGFEEWISLMNPGATATDVTLTYMFPGGRTQRQVVRMAPTSRETILVNNAVGPNQDVSTEVHATSPIIAERAMYFLYHGVWSGGDSAVGATAPGTSWFLAEGTTRNNAADGAFEEWISIQNPGDAPAHVNFTYMFPGGATKAATKEIAAHSRETVMVNKVVGPNKDVSVRLDSDNPIVVERPMYFNYHNTINGGDDVLGCQSPGKTWYFAEGTTRNNAQDGSFAEWNTLVNPGTAPATVTIKYMFTDGTTQSQQINLPAKSRTTIGVNHSLSIATVCDEIAIHPYDYPQWWGWYYKTLRNICKSYKYGDKEISVTEIGWPHKYVKGSTTIKGFTPEGQRQAIGEVGLGGLWKAGCKKIWVYEDVDSPSPWDGQYDGLFSNSGSPWPAWNEYEKWQAHLPNYGNKPNHMSARPASSTPRRSEH